MLGAGAARRSHQRAVLQHPVRRDRRCGPGSASAPGWFKLVSALTAIAALLLVAVFTAALVRRLSRPRLTALFGPRAAPARSHVLLVGFGQVGYRLAETLRQWHIPVLAVENNPQAPCLRLARRAGIPVAMRSGEDRATLELLGMLAAL